MSAAYGSYMASSSNLRYQVRPPVSQPSSCIVLSCCSGRRAGWSAWQPLPCFPCPPATSLCWKSASPLALLPTLPPAQILAGLIEERGIEAVFKSNPAACAILSFIVRTGNTFLGSLLWVDYIRCGLSDSVV